MKIVNSAIIPIRNEEENIPYIFKTLKNLNGASTEAILVEGKSTDSSWFVAKKFNGKKNEFGVVFRAIKQIGEGKAGAVTTGFNSAKGKYLIIVDADLSIDQQNLEKILSLFHTYGDSILASGSRLRGIRKPNSFYWINYIGNYFFRYYYSFILGVNILDISCGTKAITKSLWDKMNKLRDKGGKFDLWGDIDWLYYSVKVGAQIRFIDIVYRPRKFGESKLQNLGVRWKFALNMVLIGLKLLLLNMSSKNLPEKR